MKHIRIVFFDPTADNEILGYGVLDENTIELLGNYEVSVGLKMAKKPIPEAEDYIEDNKIMPLVQNEAHRLSVLVYLDGTTITNADVAIGSATSMTGSLNLQFSSSAVLEPMKYTDFESLDGSNSNSGESTNEPVITSVGVGSITENYSATIKHVSIGSINSLVAEISTTNGTVINADSGVTVTIDGANAGYATVNGVSGWQVVGTESVPEKVDITVTPNAG